MSPCRRFDVVLAEARQLIARNHGAFLRVPVDLHEARVFAAAGRSAAGADAVELAERARRSFEQMRESSVNPATGAPRGPLGTGFALRRLSLELGETPRSDDGARAATEGPGFLVCRADGWVIPPAGDPLRASHRPTLHRITLRLAHARQQRPGEPVPLDAIVASGWPDERLSRETGARRAYVALSELRRTVLRGLLLRNDKGYYLDPGVDVRIDEPT